MDRARLNRPAKEIATVVVLYAVYTLGRNLLGDDPTMAERNARRIIDLERSLGIYREPGVQAALDLEWLMQLMNTFYGLAHFAVTGVVLIWLYRRRPSYAFWRTALVLTTFVALIGYVLFPLMPPRLMPDAGLFDSLAVYGSPWDYEHGAISELSNQYAAMPSLHVAWAMWASIAMWVEGRRTPHPGLMRIGAVLHTAATLVAVVATGNHYVLDAVGGAFVLGVGFAVTALLPRHAGTATHPYLDEPPAGSEAGGSEAVVAAVDGDHVARVVAAGPAGEVDGEAPEVVR